MTRSWTASLAMTVGALALAAALPTGAAAAEKWYPYSVEVWDPPFDMASPRKKFDYVPVDKAAKAWDICVSFPHMKDAYWMAVDYGVVAESKRQGVKHKFPEPRAAKGAKLHWISLRSNKVNI